MSTPKEPAPAAPAWPGAAAEAMKLDSPLPLRLLTDWEIRERSARLVRAEEAARRLAEATAPDGALRVAQRLADQGAAPNLMERARNAAREDQLYAQEKGARAHAQAERLHEQTEQAGVGLQRRQQLTAAQQQAEAADRMRQRPVAPAPSARPVAGPSVFAPQPADTTRQRADARPF
ncbi:hypothetical protein ABT009_30550 [Streptomyces sp. NPDC002896]|uniref:hypothetical protein n=1 Tax=Streptomyces sp. NPDC002896 TaxID=3154438 RepID=UPI00332F47AA